MLGKGAKRTIVYHIKVILQYCWDKTIARSRDMYRDDLSILSLVIKCFSITHSSVQNFAIRIYSVKTVPMCLRKLKFFNKFNIDDWLMSSLRAIVINFVKKYFGNHVISSQIHLLNFYLYLTWGAVLCVVNMSFFVACKDSISLYDITISLFSFHTVFRERIERCTTYSDLVVNGHTFATTLGVYLKPLTQWALNLEKSAAVVRYHNNKRGYELVIFGIHFILLLRS